VSYRASLPSNVAHAGFNNPAVCTVTGTHVASSCIIPANQAGTTTFWPAPIRTVNITVQSLGF
jgi:hypothetical protein